MLDKDDIKRNYEDVEMEIGGTAGRTHADVLNQTIGRERMLRNMTAGGPPTAPREVSRSDDRVEGMEE